MIIRKIAPVVLVAVVLAACTPGRGMSHLLGCELIGWSVPVESFRSQRIGGPPTRT